MNIKELADIGSKAACEKITSQLGGDCHILAVGSQSSYLNIDRPAREAFAQAVIDAYLKSVDEPAPVKDKWAALAAYEAGHDLEWRRPADGIHNWQAITWSGPPQFNKYNEYRIASKPEETDDMLKKRVHELMAENRQLKQWKSEMLTINKKWDAVDAFVRHHPRGFIGDSIVETVLTWLKQADKDSERQEFETWHKSALNDAIQDLGDTSSKNIAWDAWKAARKSK